MARTASPRPDTAELLAPLAVIALVAIPAAVTTDIWIAGHLASWLSGNGWTGPALNTALVRTLVNDGIGAPWPGTHPILIAALAITQGILLLSPLIGLLVWRLHRSLGPRQAPGALARPKDVRSLAPTGVADRAGQLRPTLLNPQRVDATEHGIRLGQLLPRGPVLRASWEDVGLAIMAPRSGKTTSLAVETILDAPGPAIGTSNKSDLYLATTQLRARITGQRVWAFDPQQIVFAPQDWWWNPLTTATEFDGAHRLAEHFVQTISGRGERTFWDRAALDLLTSLLLAAASEGGSLVDVDTWLGEPWSPEPAAILARHGHDSSARALIGRQNGAPETRDGIYETARTATQCLRDPKIMSWVTPPPRPLPQFQPDAFASTRETLHLLAKDGAGSAAPLVAALVDQVMRAGVRAAERAGGRHDPPITVVLDEAANICRIADLPDLYSHLGSRGIVALTILQSYQQGVRVWGPAGMDTLWSAATIKLIGAGLDDPRLAEDISRLIGDHDVEIRSRSYGRTYRDHSSNISLRRQRILPPEDIRALPRGQALLFATGMKPALIQLLPWYQGTRAQVIADAQQAAGDQLTARARGIANEEVQP